MFGFGPTDADFTFQFDLKIEGKTWTAHSGRLPGFTVVDGENVRDLGTVGVEEPKPPRW
jgi:hypothetical protein